MSQGVKQDRTQARTQSMRTAHWSVADITLKTRAAQCRAAAAPCPVAGKQLYRQFLLQWVLIAAGPGSRPGHPHPSRQTPSRHQQREDCLGRDDLGRAVQTEQTLNTAPTITSQGKLFSATLSFGAGRREKRERVRKQSALLLPVQSRI